MNANSPKVYFDTLPSLVDYIFGRFSFLVSEPPIPDGKVRARWECVSHRTHTTLTALNNNSAVDVWYEDVR